MITPNTTSDRAIQDPVYRWLAQQPIVSSRSAIGIRKILMRFGPGIPYYEQRLADLGIRVDGRVLDAGCGYGHWSVALARSARQVVALDLNDKFLPVAREVLAHFGKGRAGAVKGRVEEAPMPDSSMDAVVCSEVFLYTDTRSALAELARLLRPGGRLYLLTAGPGYHLEYIVHAARRLALPQLAYWTAELGATMRHMLLGARARTRPIVGFHFPSALGRFVGQAGFRVIGVGPAGTVSNRSGLAPLRRARYLGLPCWFEILAERSDEPPPSASAGPPRANGSRLDAALGLGALVVLSPYLAASSVVERVQDRRYGRERPLISTIQAVDG